MYVRYVAWLKCVPDKQKLSRERVLLDSENVESIDEIDMPDIHNLEHVVEWLRELGFCNFSESYFVSLRWEQISSWITAMRYSLQPKVVSLIMDLSREYAHQANISKVYLCPSPYNSEEMINARREETQRKLRAAF
tara:strand:+ start:127 stop:534 length:408 start_codon:yes stop_codon:yes gene_type:complete